jgi:septal ring factor EnvC (AmiA/AmiB activator)
VRPRLAAALALIAVVAGGCGIATAVADASDAPEGASAESAGAEQPGADLERLRGQIAELEERVRSLEARKAEARAERERLETELALASLRVREGEAERRQLEADEAAAAREAEDSRGALAAAGERLRRQLAVLAVLGRAGLWPLAVRTALEGTDATRRITVMVLLVREQERQRGEVARLAEQRAAALAALSLRRAELEAAYERLGQRRAELATTRERVAAEVVRLEEDRRAGAVALADAIAAEARLERLWGTVTADRAGVRADVEILRGGLPWPVRDAPVVRGFGPHRDPRYGTVTVSNGLYLSVPGGRTVTAIAPGTVAYAQFFKGYGNLVIVQHGERLYSLYARLSSMLISAGRRVAMGDPLGVVGPAGDQDGNFYLELRLGQEPQDPSLWLEPVRE